MRSSGNLQSSTLQLLGAIVLTCLFLGSIPTYAQTGPGGVGNTSGSAGQPRNIIWLDATALGLPDGSAVGSWTDRSGNGHDATRAVSAQQPVIVGTSPLNGRPFVRFDGVDDALTLNTAIATNSDGILNQDYSFIFVGARRTSTGNDGWLLYGTGPFDTQSNLYVGWRGGGSSQFRFSQFGSTELVVSGDNYLNDGVNEYAIFTGTFSQTASPPRKLYENGGLIGTRTGTQVLTSYPGAEIGGISGSNECSVDIAETIFYQGSLNEVQVVIINNYLNAKYNLSLVGFDTVDRDFYDGDTPANGDYDYDVIGIAQVSATTHTEATSGGFTLSADSSLDTDGEYVFAGHNNTPVGVTTADLSAGVEQRWSRDWYIEKTGNLGAVLNFNLRTIAANENFNPQASDYVLLRWNGSTYQEVPISLGNKSADGNSVTFNVSNSDLINGRYTIGTLNVIQTPLDGFDADQDGVKDVADLDDDNDGIPDTAENLISNSPYVAYWPLDNITDDSSTNNYNLVSGSVSYVTDNVQGGASASFNGTTEYLSYNNGTFLNQAIQSFTYSFWIKPTTLSGIQTLLDEGGSGNGVAIRLNDNILENAIREGSGTQVSTSSFVFPADGDWHKVELVYANGLMRMFLDGVGSTIIDTGFGTLGSHSDQQNFGRTANSDAFGTSTRNYYQGLMDEIFYYTGATLSLGSIDSDNDGIPNQFDLDSDNDGIYDSEEAGHNAPHTNGIVIGNVGTNGWLDLLETTADSGVSAYVLEDTDANNIANFLELDSDNDGCSDANEAYEDADADGGDDQIYGIGIPVVDSNGLVTTASYTVTNYPNALMVGPDSDSDGFIDGCDDEFNDIDNDGVADVFDLDDDNDGILDIIEQCSFQEDFNDQTLDSFLEESGSNSAPGVNIDYSGNNANFDHPTNDTSTRNYIRTVANNFYDQSVQFEVTAFMPNSNSPAGTPFVGLGPGVANPAYFGEPLHPILGANIRPDLNRLYFHDKVPGDSYPTSNSEALSDVSNTQVRFRIDWNAETKLARIEVDVDYNGSIFIADHSRLFDGSDNTFNSTNMRVYFGGGNGIVFDDFEMLVDCDTDLDGVPNRLDLDSDNDGIYDVVESGGSDSNNDGIHDDDDNNTDNTATNGVPSAANGGTGNTPTDTGSDGTFDFLNTDADAEGCSDVAEAGFTDGDGDGQLGSAPITVGGNGLVIGAGGYTAPGTAYTDNAVDTCDDDNDGVINSSDICPGFDDLADNDTDGVPDGCDLDDDNDGIPDVSEDLVLSAPPGYDAYWPLDNSTNDFSGNSHNLTGGGVTYSTDNVQGGASGSFNGTSNYLRYNDGTFLNQAITSFTYGFWIKPTNLTGIQTLLDEGSSYAGIAIRLNGNLLENIIVDPSNGGLPFSTTSLTFPNDGAWHHVAYTFDNGVIVMYLDGVASDIVDTGLDALNRHTNAHSFGRSTHDAFGESTGNYFEGLMDEIYHYPIALSEVNLSFLLLRPDDIDGDGIANRLDLDSDNDGIYDAEEAGHGQPYSNGRLNGSVGTDGIPDSAQALGNENSGIINYTLRDTDTNGIQNFVSEDSDMDGCDDVNEAYGSGFDGDGDGIYGTGIPTVSLSGLVDGASYATPIDGNANTIQDYIEVGTSVTITTQPEEVIILISGETAVFSVTSDADLFQWQVSTDSGNTFTDLIGENLNTLTIANVPSSYHGNRYRAVLNKRDYSCGTTITGMGTLVIDDDSDTDGIRDLLDLDDDNDGIPDIEEGIPCSGNLFVNADFALGISDWNPLGNAKIQSYNPDAITFNAGNREPNGSVFQTITTEPSHLYQLDFFVGNDGSLHPGLGLEIQINGVAMGTFRPSQDHQLFFKALSNTTTITFKDVSTATSATDVFLRAPSLCVLDQDTDGDGIPNSLDLDSDGDGCTDVLEAGFTDGDNDGELGNAPLTVDGNGVVTGQGGYLTPQDQDTNGIMDYVEAGAAPTITQQPISQETFVTGSVLFEVTANADTYQWQISTDAGATYNDITGEDQPQLAVNNVSASQDGTMYRVVMESDTFLCGPTISDEVVLRVYPDSDGDGIGDPLDKDDDNDGIPDTEEELACTGNLFTDPNFGNGLSDWNPLGNVRILSTRPTAATFNSGNSVPNGSISQSITTIPGFWYQINMVIGMPQSPVGMALQVEADGQVLGIFTDDTNANVVFQATGNTTLITFEDASTLTIGRDVFVSTPSICLLDRDSDLDGVVDRLDLDSDNDGIYDVIEAGHGQSPTNGVLVGSVGNDGIPDVVQNNGAEDSETINYTVADTDTNTVIDALDNDSDGDGCTDVIEAGFIDGDTDGELGSAPITVDGDGLVTSAVGYTTPDDNNSNGVFDFQEAGSITLSTVPTDITVYPGDTTNFTVDSNVNYTYQWQLSTDGGLNFNDITASPTYTGVQDATLTINNVTAAMNGYLYLVEVTDVSFVCTPTISPQALLTVQGRRVITNRRITYRVKN